MLEIEQCGISSIGFATFLHSMKFNGSITSLTVDKNDLSGRGIHKWKEMLHSNKILSKLSMVKCNLGDIGASIIAKGYYRNNFLTHINLRGNNIGDEGATSIANHLRGTKKNYLKALNLSNNMITEMVAIELIKSANPMDRPVCHLGNLILYKFSSFRQLN